MKLTIHDIGYMLVGIAKPLKDNHTIFCTSLWNWKGGYWLYLYVAPMGRKEENLTTYFTNVYCNYTLTAITNGEVVRSRCKVCKLEEDLKAFLGEVLSLKERYID